MRERITPEERLLRLIKGQTKPQPVIPPKAQIPARDRPRNFRPKILSIISILSLGYLAFSFLYPMVGLRKIELPPAAEKIEEPQAQSHKQEVKPYEFYMEGISQRQIFGGPAAPDGGSVNVIVNSDLIKDISLVGIVSGDNPQAIIEDKKINKTYYLSKGQFIGEFQLTDIQEGKIRLDYKGQKFELYL